MSWADGPLALFDTETTCPDPLTARLVTATVGVGRPGRAVTVTEWLADPGVDIRQGATDVHGITTAYARVHGRPAAEVIEEVAAELGLAWSLGLPVVGYNVGYDLTLIAAESKRHGLAAFTCIGPVVDGRVLDQHVDRYRKGKRTLTDVCAHYQVQLDGAHDATADATAAGRVVWRIAQRYPEIGRMPLDELHAAQARWHAEHQHRFAEYLCNRIGGQVQREAEEADCRGYHELAEQKHAEVADLVARAGEIDATADQWPIRTGGAL